MFRHPCLLSAGLIGAVLVAGAAQAKTTEIQVIQPGDSARSCEALATEINALSADQAKASKRAASGKKFMSFASTAMQVAGPMLSGGMGKMGGDGGMGAIMAQQAMGQMQAQAMQQQMTQAYGGYGAEPAPTVSDDDGGLRGQRLTRLNDLHAQKGC